MSKNPYENIEELHKLCQPGNDPVPASGVEITGFQCGACRHREPLNMVYLMQGQTLRVTCRCGATVEL